MKVLITGAKGQLGQALLRLSSELSDIEVFPFASKELDITNEAMVEATLTRLHPDVLINCAAHTAVDACETDAENAYRINALGPKYLAQACQAVDAAMVQVSTDYVFDGTKTTPYIESDLPNPQSVYGSTKLAGEEQAAKYLDRLYIVRSAWLYGEGHNFVRTMLRLAAEGKPLKVVNDQYGTPTSHLELARMILFLIQTENYGIYHATCEGFTTWYNFAREIFALTNTQVSLSPVATNGFKTAAKRPAYSVLENHKLNTETVYRMADWHDALLEYLKEENLL
ncbi:MAG: dTDP-4-dehydrorhamnose reductase [Acetivibrio ethanolgignens]